MASLVIYDSRTNSNTQGAGWVIVQDPYFRGNLYLVRFYRSNGQRCLLDRIALWDPHAQAWKAGRWLPKPPTVPQWLLAKVEAHMRDVAATTLDQDPDDDERLDWDNHPSLTASERNPSLR